VAALRADRLTLDVAHVDSLSSAQWLEIVDLCAHVFDEDFQAIFANLPDTTHVLARVDGVLVSHACWVVRWLQPGGLRPLRTAFVEAVATAPDHRSRGYATAVVRRTAAEIAGFALGGLSTGIPTFYERLGWERWRGPLSIRTDDGPVPTLQDSAMVLRLAAAPELDLDAPMSAEWRPSEPW
jgi:aminoglycoside 2'-N-acetyltransferase I